MRNIHTVTKKILLLIVVLAAYAHNANAQEIQNGYLDLSHYSFEKDGNFSLSGNWEFYPESFYPLERKKEYIKVPSRWNKNTFPNGHTHNFGVYRLRIKLPEAEDRKMALRLTGIGTAYALYIDDKEIIKVGKPGNSKETSTPRNQTLTQHFLAQGQMLEIKIVVSNYHQRWGGISFPPLLGISEKVQAASDTAFNSEAFLFGSLFVILIFHLGLYIFGGRRERAMLYFIWLQFFQLTYTICVGETSIMHIFPELPWEWNMKIRYISNAARIIFLILFLYSAYSQHIKKKIPQILVGICLPVILFIAITPAYISYPSVSLPIVAVFIIFAYTISVQIKALIKRQPGVLLPFLGVFIMMLTAINDALLSFGLIKSLFLSTYGLFIFNFAQSYLLAFQSIWTLKQRELQITATSKSEGIKTQLSESKIENNQDILKIITKEFEATQSYLYSVKNGNELDLDSSYPDPKKINVSETLLKNTLNNKKTILIDNVMESSYVGVLSKQLNIRALVCIPFIANNQVQALLYLETTSDNNVFTQQTVNILEDLSGYILDINHNIDLQKEQKIRIHKLKQIIDEKTNKFRTQKVLMEAQNIKIASSKQKLRKNYGKIKVQKEFLDKSSTYVRVIQEDNLPKQAAIDKIFTKNFVLFLPGTSPSSDFYRLYEPSQTGGKNLLILADAKRRGAPGGLISIVTNYFLNRIVSTINSPGNILKKLQEKVIVEGSNAENSTQDLLDIAIIAYDPDKKRLEYAGAHMDLFLFQNKKLEQIKSGTQPLFIGKPDVGANKKQIFRTHTFTVKEGDILYLATDGFRNQIGGKDQKRFTEKSFVSLLKNITNIPLEGQATRLESVLEDWHHQEVLLPQTDDVTIIGIQF